ncbi:ATP-binding protein [Streptomyces sp. GSL17-113]|uniref:ATP-binding protein n=1 Tax=Streptomyces sp. GSL17-113 TaxID=3115365 RepID=UPI002E75AE17|nr:ATP-binding protein [Streptomyces sp. GSL17-113]
MSNKITACPPVEALDFSVLLSATRRGARLARLMTVAELSARGLPTESAALVVAELAANAALHGAVPGRSFRLRVSLHETALLRVEVTDARGERAPVAGPRQPPGADSEAGRGLVLVEALAERWGVRHGPGPCKTVWADIALAPRAESTGSRPAATRSPTAPTP